MCNMPLCLDVTASTPPSDASIHIRLPMYFIPVMVYSTSGYGVIEELITTVGVITATGLRAMERVLRNDRRQGATYGTP